ncbi:hypothetical protein XBKB1_2230006 [Xenorhabdus bovienii str. kraussei Becker Underwood]|uniref:Uncharacterized protein n=1 Tax=Xenorhabdus bovienii str. kraussei Becker Underwood TaxID=1398204 RepID=A0A077PSC8_XENBV|nr:hypothetical protein XBKB1_2230006 [Xenorhabdus bovienii str. kraussei Becker Underwood]
MFHVSSLYCAEDKSFHGLLSPSLNISPAAICIVKNSAFIRLSAI